MARTTHDKGLTFRGVPSGPATRNCSCTTWLCVCATAGMEKVYGFRSAIMGSIMTVPAVGPGACASGSTSRRKTAPRPKFGGPARNVSSRLPARVVQA